MISIKEVSCEYSNNPIGLDIHQPRLSWKISSDRRGVFQTAYQIQVSYNEGFDQIVFDSGKITSSDSIHIELKDLTLASQQRYYYRIKIWSDEEQSEWSETAFWEMGLLQENEWTAEWISPPLSIFPQDREECPVLRTNFVIEKNIKSARIYATALGLYTLFINGSKVGDRYFTPGWTSYNNRLQYQTYDVTHLLNEGEQNAVGAFLGNGWFKGNLAWEHKKHIYGDRLALLFLLKVTYEDGTTTEIISNGDWKINEGPISYSEIYHGETYDARKYDPSWSTAEFCDENWVNAEVIKYPKTHLVAQYNEPVRAINYIKPIKLFTTPKGEVVIDMGQNMVGWIRFSINGHKGQEVQLKHAEVLDQEGNLYVNNLRTAKQTIRYICKGDGVETYEPTFTFQGFRYVQLIGFNEDCIELGDFIGVVLHTDMTETGYFECSDPLINQLQHNINWGLKGNFLDVPTDCPQRDERLGWTGDAQMFIRTASYLRNVAPFFTKWLKDLKADQKENGSVPFVVPDVLQGDENESAAWGDAAVICPWTIYQCYGDTRILEEQYDSMKAWVEYIRKEGENEYLWNTGFHFGDWLALDSKPDSSVGATDKDFIATAFYAYSTRLLQKSAEIIGKHSDAKEYKVLYENILKEFSNEFITPSGRIAVSTQTAQLLPLMFDLIDGTAKEKAINKLITLLEDTDYHLTTGFVGTPYLNLVLSEHGYNDVAYKLLFQQDYPSWLYQVTKGATTIWEHWDGIKEDGSFWSDEMNSFNHYAYGSIGDWLYRKVVGIDMENDSCAYKKSVINPLPNDGLSYAKGELETMYGTIRSSWKKHDSSYQIQVSIPANTTGKIIFPESVAATIHEYDTMKKLEDTDGVLAVNKTEHGVSAIVGSGDYYFIYS